MTTLPKRDGKDIAHGATKAALAAIPMVGGSLAEVFQLVVEPSLEKRRTAWLDSLANEVESVRSRLKDWDPGKLVGDERFVSAILQASSAAMRTHDATKLDALRNAVLNTALRPEIDEVVSAMFLALIDQLTPSHLRVLAYFDDPAKWARDHGRAFPDHWSMGSPTQPLLHALPELAGHDKLYVPLIQDLYARGLIDMSPDSLNTTMHAPSAQRAATTNLGKRFLSFIATPQV